MAQQYDGFGNPILDWQQGIPGWSVATGPSMPYTGSTRTWSYDPEAAFPDLTPWTPPQGMQGTLFPDQTSIDAFQAALNPQSYGVRSGPDRIGRTDEPALSKQQQANKEAAMLWGRQMGILPEPKDESLFSLSNMAPFLMAAGPFAAAMGAFAPAAAAGGATAGGTGSYGGMALGGGSGAATSTAASGSGLAGGVTGASGPVLGSGGLNTGVGVGAGLQGTLAGSGMTSGPAATGIATTTGGTSGGLGGFLNKVFGTPSGGTVTGTTTGDVIGGLLGGGLDLYSARKREDAAKEAAGLADPFASQRPQYQAQLAQLMADPNRINQDPSYLFRLKAGQDLLERSNATRGYLGSGNMMQELQQYGQKSASDELQNQYARLAQLSGANFGPGTAGSNYLEGQRGGIAQQYQGLSQLGSLGGRALTNLFGGNTNPDYRLA